VVQKSATIPGAQQAGQAIEQCQQDLIKWSQSINTAYQECTWVGEAANAMKAAIDDWHGKSTQIHGLLTQMSDRLGVTASSQGTTETGNQSAGSAATY
jgi:hypothetical protein